MNPEPFVYPASYFVFAFLFLLTAISITALVLARRSGELDNEEIKYKVFDDGILNPRTEPEHKFQRSTAAPARARDRQH